MGSKARLRASEAMVGLASDWCPEASSRGPRANPATGVHPLPSAWNACPLYGSTDMITQPYVLSIACENIAAWSSIRGAGLWAHYLFPTLTDILARLTNHDDPVSTEGLALDMLSETVLSPQTRPLRRNKGDHPRLPRPQCVRITEERRGL